MNDRDMATPFSMIFVKPDVQAEVGNVSTAVDVGCNTDELEEDGCF